MTVILLYIIGWGDGSGGKTAPDTDAGLAPAAHGPEQGQWMSFRVHEKSRYPPAAS
jgi:hypothetical protein